MAGRNHYVLRITANYGSARGAQLALTKAGRTHRDETKAVAAAAELSLHPAIKFVEVSYVYESHRGIWREGKQQEPQ